MLTLGSTLVYIGLVFLGFAVVALVGEILDRRDERRRRRQLRQLRRDLNRMSWNRRDYWWDA